MRGKTTKFFTKIILILSVCFSVHLFSSPAQSADVIILGLMADFQSSNFQGGDDIFVPDQDLGEVDVAYYHVGFVFQGDHPKIQPFGVFSIGATNISPDLAGLDSETKFSTSFGGGVKIFFSKNVGMRLEGRGFYTVLDSEDDYDYCDYYCYGYTDDMWQGEVRAGLIMRF